MALSSEALADRRRMRRRLIWWRSLAAIAIALAVFAWAGVAGLGGLANKGDYVAWLAIDGVIVSDDARRDALQAVAEDEDLGRFARRHRRRRAAAPNNETRENHRQWIDKTYPRHISPQGGMTEDRRAVVAFRQPGQQHRRELPQI